MTFPNLTVPATIINGYVWYSMKQIDPSVSKGYGNKLPFFPITDAASGTKSWENKAYFIYDRIVKMKRTPFYPMKQEHLLYYLKGNEQQTLEWGVALQQILDRGDDAAQDINLWNESQDEPGNVYFHSICLDQINTGDMSSSMLTRDFSTRPNIVTQFVVVADYHFANDFGRTMFS
jgi:hypothetical protein